MTYDNADVLITGAGPAGGAAALRLVQAGLSVVCLEQGDWPDPLAFRGAELDGELTSLRQWSWDPNIRVGSADYAIDLTHAEQDIANFNGVGGGTVLFNALWPRMTPSNFRSRSLAGYGEDWPIDYRELLPYYERTDSEVGVSGLGANPAYPHGVEPTQPPLPIWAGGLRVARAHARLGWHWWPETNAILSSADNGRKPCVARGTCMTGCGEGAKGSADVTYWRRVQSLGCKVITGARVTRIVLDTAGRAAGAEWYDEDGNGFLQAADVVLCAANGIGTPRLLLASADSRFPDGLANGSGLVGKNLMLHHHGMTLGIFEDQLETWHGQAGAWINCYEFYESDQSERPPGTARWALSGAAATPLTSALGLGRDAWGEGHHEALAKGLGRTLCWAICVEDLTSGHNRLELSMHQTDSTGVPIPVVHYRISEESKALRAWHQRRAAESLVEAGAVSVRTPEFRPVTGHFMGTARMGDDPRSSVVDRSGISHEIPNLGILDASVFVTSAGVNPTSTVCALASRAADRLLEHRHQVPRPERSTSHWVGPWSVAPVPDRSTPEVTELSADERQRLAMLAELLIPGDARHPSPRDVGIADDLAKAVLRARPDLGPALRRALSADEVPASASDRFLETDLEARMALELVVAGGYYMSPAVRVAIGYPIERARPTRVDLYPAYVHEGLLDHMLVDLPQTEHD